MCFAKEGVTLKYHLDPANIICNILKNQQNQVLGIIIKEVMQKI